MNVCSKDRSLHSLFFQSLHIVLLQYVKFVQTFLSKYFRFFRHNCENTPLKGGIVQEIFLLIPPLNDSPFEGLQVWVFDTSLKQEEKRSAKS